MSDRKISAMYRVSGGTDYRHTCYECPNCRKGKKEYSCKLFEEAGGKGPWKPSFIACKYYGYSHMPGIIPQEESALWQQDDGEQMTIFDYPELIPEGMEKNGTE